VLGVLLALGAELLGHSGHLHSNQRPSGQDTSKRELILKCCRSDRKSYRASDDLIATINATMKSR
jgi:hypothetical protein